MRKKHFKTFLNDFLIVFSCEKYQNHYKIVFKIDALPYCTMLGGEKLSNIKTCINYLY